MDASQTPLSLAVEWSQASQSCLDRLDELESSDLACRVESRRSGEPSKLYHGRSLELAHSIRMELDALRRQSTALNKVCSVALELAKQSRLGSSRSRDSEVLKLFSTSRISPSKVHDLPSMAMDSNAPASPLSPSEALADFNQRFSELQHRLRNLFLVDSTFHKLRLELLDQRVAWLTHRVKAIEALDGLDLPLALSPKNILSFDASAFDGNDPLSQSEISMALLKSMEESAQALDHWMAHRTSACNGLNLCSAGLIELRALHARNALAVEEGAHRFVHFVEHTQIVTMPEIDKLDAWCRRLREECNQGNAEAALVGLEKLKAATQEKIQRSKVAYAANRFPIDRLGELRGLFGAQRAKAALLSSQGAQLGDALLALQNQCKQALYAKPIDLNQCEHWCKAFDAAMTELRR